MSHTDIIRVRHKYDEDIKKLIFEKTPVEDCEFFIGTIDGEMGYYDQVYYKVSMAKSHVTRNRNGKPAQIHKVKLVIIDSMEYVK